MTRELIDEILESIGLEKIKCDDEEHNAGPGHSGRNRLPEGAHIPLGKKKDK